MLPSWPTDVFGFPVVKSPIGSAGPLSAVTNVVLHTTEGPEDGDPRPTFAARGDAPHFAVSAKDGGTIWQLRSLEQWAAALRHGTLPPGADSPNAHALQIEICGSAELTPWLPPPVIAERVAAVVAYMAEYHDVPLVVPNAGWADDCSDMPMPWAANNVRRQWAGRDGHWPYDRGVWGHVEVPWQDPTWHYDPGAMRRSLIIDAAKALLAPPQKGFPMALTDAQQAEIYTRALEDGNERAGRKIRLGVSTQGTVTLTNGAKLVVTKDTTKADYLAADPDSLGLWNAFSLGKTGA